MGGNHVSILVSINCITYNHEKYIKDALESFLMQKTDFEFEIIVGEDCSTDNTRKIVEEYVNKNPKKIILVTSEENVGMIENERRIYLKSKGKYIAECEGDDYWLDPYKLQKQVDYMESHQECTLCFHNANLVTTNKNLIDVMISEEIQNGIYDVGELAKLGVIATNSKLYPKYTLENLPDWYDKCIVTDLPAQLIIASQGYAYYMNEIMSVYRVGVENSAMYRLAGNKFKSIEERVLLPKESLKILDYVDKYSEYKYSKNIDERKKHFEFKILYIKGDIKSIKGPRYSKLYTALRKTKKMGMYVQAYLPQMYVTLARFYEKIKNIFRQNK